MRDERQSSERRGLRLRRLMLGALAVLVVAGVVVVALMAIRANTSETASVRVRLPDEGRNHVAVDEPVHHEHLPPASGQHYPITARYGVYARTLKPGLWVHNLEHGAIVLLYKCTDDCDDVLAKTETVRNQLPNGDFGEVKFIATPYEDMEPKFTLVAWRWHEPFEKFDAQRVRDFYRDFVDRGPERAP